MVNDSCYAGIIRYELKNPCKLSHLEIVHNQFTDEPTIRVFSDLRSMMHTFLVHFVQDILDKFKISHYGTVLYI